MENKFKVKLDWLSYAQKVLSTSTTGPWVIWNRISNYYTIILFILCKNHVEADWIDIK